MEKIGKLSKDLIRAHQLRHVGARVNTTFGVLRKSDLESLPDILKNLLILLAANKRNRQTLGTETTSTTNAVQVRVGLSGQIVVNSKVDTLNVNTTSKNVGGDTDTLVELLEFLVTFDTKLVVSMEFYSRFRSATLTAPLGSHQSAPRY